MKKTLLLLPLLFFTATLFSQVDWTKYETIVDAHSKDIKELSQLITKDFSTPREQTEAIYYWVTNNIKYDARELKKMMKKGNSKPQKMTLEAIQAQRAAMVQETIKQKKGICQDYSLLFKALCTHADIECEFIGGWVKNDPLRTKGMGGSHAWNAVKINDEWEVLDATFGSGYTTRKGKFKFSFNPNYFFTDKEIFKMNHFPREEKWQLSDAKVDKNAFKKYPFLGSGFIDLNSKNISPLENKIYIKRGASADITFESEKPIANLVVVNMKKQKLMECEVVRTDNQNTITLDASEFRNGLYSFFDGEQLLFAYRVSVR